VPASRAGKGKFSEDRTFGSGKGKMKNVGRREVVSCLTAFIFKLNQPTSQRLTKDGVRRRRETSSLARFYHSCVRNALLGMVNGALN
jgi:hypothetical protein